MNFQEFMETKRNWFTSKMEEILEELNSPNRLKSSMLYSIDAGGKRFRPILMLAAFQAFNLKDEKALVPAIALEMVHTYSLIHDDLPSMDNDDYRRGKPTNHKQFDEATAILAGDGLLTHAFYVVASSPLLEAEEKIFVTRELAKAAGPEGMVAGQMLDLEAEERTLTIDEMENVHLLKTGQLIQFAVRIGAYLGGATPPQLEAIDEYSKCIGLIFQIQDDILDVIGNEKLLGKSIGSDEQKHKSTYPKVIGLQGAIQKKEQLMEMAKQSLEQANVHSGLLYEIIDYLGKRDH